MKKKRKKFSLFLLVTIFLSFLLIGNIKDNSHTNKTVTNSKKITKVSNTVISQYCFYPLIIKELQKRIVLNNCKKEPISTLLLQKVFYKQLNAIEINVPKLYNITKFPTNEYIKNISLKRKRFSHIVFNIYKHQVSTKLGRT